MLYFSFGSVIATGDNNKTEHLTFNSCEEAENWAKKNCGLALYEAFEVKK